MGRARARRWMRGPQTPHTAVSPRYLTSPYESVFKSSSLRAMQAHPTTFGNFKAGALRDSASLGLSLWSLFRAQISTSRARAGTRAGPQSRSAPPLPRSPPTFAPPLDMDTPLKPRNFHSLSPAPSAFGHAASSHAPPGPALTEATVLISRPPTLRPPLLSHAHSAPTRSAPPTPQDGPATLSSAHSAQPRPPRPLPRRRAGQHCGAHSGLVYAALLCLEKSLI
jgi:hypothetical protein